MSAIEQDARIYFILANYQGDSQYIYELNNLAKLYTINKEKYSRREHSFNYQFNIFIQCTR
jgi:hypothetical protein